MAYMERLRDCITVSKFGRYLPSGSHWHHQEPTSSSTTTAASTAASTTTSEHHEHHVVTNSTTEEVETTAGPSTRGPAAVMWPGHAKSAGFHVACDGEASYTRKSKLTSKRHDFGLCRVCF